MEIETKKINVCLSELKYNWIIINKNWDNNIKYIKNDDIKNYKKIKTITMIQGIKEILLNEFGYIPIYFFLNLLFENYNYSGCYRTVEKGLILLYHMLQGGDKNKYINLISEYKKIYEEFWIYRNEELNKKVDTYLKTLFSNIRLRLINGEIYNPQDFKNLTYIFDSYIKTYSINHSNKIYEKGYITQFLCDNNGFITYISESKSYYQEQNKGIMYEKLHFWDICLDIDDGDIVTVDEEHINFKDIFISNTKKKIKKNIDDSFICPIDNENLETEIIHYNSNLIEFHNGGNRTINNVEKLFKILDDKNYIKNSDPKEYNLQLKICILLYNIKLFVDKYNITEQSHHKLWADRNFDFFTTKITNNIINKENINIYQQNDILKKKTNIQKKYFDNF